MFIILAFLALWIKTTTLLDYTHPFAIVYISTHVLFFLTLLMAFFFSLNIRKLQLSWEAGTMEVVKGKIANHIDKPS